MVSVIIFAVIAIALTTAASLALLSAFEASTIMTTEMEEVSRLDTVVALLETQMRRDENGVLVAPAGRVDTVFNYYTLPSLGMPTVGRNDQPYMYCPFSTFGGDPDPGETSVETVPDGQGGSYTIYTRPYGADNKPFVVGIDTTSAAFNDATVDDEDETITVPPTNIVAAVIAPSPDAAAPTSCLDLELDAVGRFSLGAAGAVRVVSIQEGQGQRALAAAGEVHYYVTNGDASTALNAGFSAATPISLQDALANWNATKPRYAEIHFAAPGVYNLSAQVTDADNNLTTQIPYLNINPEGVLVDWNDTSGNNVFHANVTANNVLFRGDFTVPSGARARFVNSSFWDSLTVEEGGKVYATSSTRASRPAPSGASYNSLGSTINSLSIEQGAEVELEALNGSGDEDGRFNVVGVTGGGRLTVVPYDDNDDTTISGLNMVQPGAELVLMGDNDTGSCNATSDVNVTLNKPSFEGATVLVADTVCLGIDSSSDFAMALDHSRFSVIDSAGVQLLSGLSTQIEAVNGSEVHLGGDGIESTGATVDSVVYARSGSEVFVNGRVGYSSAPSYGVEIEGGSSLYLHPGSRIGNGGGFGFLQAAVYAHDQALGVFAPDSSVFGGAADGVLHEGTVGNNCINSGNNDLVGLAAPDIYGSEAGWSAVMTQVGASCGGISGGAADWAAVDGKLNCLAAWVEALAIYNLDKRDTLLVPMSDARLAAHCAP